MPDDCKKIRLFHQIWEWDIEKREAEGLPVKPKYINPPDHIIFRRLQCQTYTSERPSLNPPF